jgi:predicted enzyme related to lactoylglutathione lyase
VDDVQRAVDAVKSNGGQVVNGPMEVSGGDWVAQCVDPQGASFAVHAKKK